MQIFFNDGTQKDTKLLLCPFQFTFNPFDQYVSGQKYKFQPSFPKKEALVYLPPNYV